MNRRIILPPMLNVQILFSSLHPTPFGMFQEVSILEHPWKSARILPRMLQDGDLLEHWDVPGGLHPGASLEVSPHIVHAAYRNSRGLNHGEPSMTSVRNFASLNLSSMSVGSQLGKLPETGVRPGAFLTVVGWKEFVDVATVERATNTIALSNWKRWHELQCGCFELKGFNHDDEHTLP